MKAFLKAQIFSLTFLASAVASQENLKFLCEAHLTAPEPVFAQDLDARWEEQVRGVVGRLTAFLDGSSGGSFDVRVGDRFYIQRAKGVYAVMLDQKAEPVSGVSDVAVAHEFGHIVFHRNLMLTLLGEKVRFGEMELFFERKIKEKKDALGITAMHEKRNRALDEGTNQEMIDTARELDAMYEEKWHPIRKQYEANGAIEWGLVPYDEVFADVFGVLFAEDLGAISAAFGGKIRDFDPAKSDGDEPQNPNPGYHEFFDPVRWYLGKFLKKAIETRDPASKREQARKVLWAFLEATAEHIEIRMKSGDKIQVFLSDPAKQNPELILLLKKRLGENP